MTTSAQILREAILSARLETSNFGGAPQPEELYLPFSHLKALKLDAHIVVGGRGVGKSFWTSALQSNPLRGLLGSVATELQNIDVRVGFASNEAIKLYPNADVFLNFIDHGGEPYDMWRAVILRWVGERMNFPIPSKEWGDTVSWLTSVPEQAAQLMNQPRDWTGLLLFDALDRTSDNWERMDAIVKGLLRAVLWLKPFGNLYAKVFLRDDQAERKVFDFPDASKLLATRAELIWSRHDLHGMLWQRLVNAPGTSGKALRVLCPTSKQGDFYQLPPEMKSESTTQRKAFEGLAGVWMGRDRRRGVPYVWSVGHLADGRGRTSPRSFLAAIQQAAEDTRERYPQHEVALHFESIKRGIQKASEIRVQEMAEDYPWVPAILLALEGLNVPIASDLVVDRWKEAFPNGPDGLSSGLPAPHAENGWGGLQEDLQRLGLMETKKDGRIDMPDLYRVGFGLGRKGGVRPRN